VRARRRLRTAPVRYAKSRQCPDRVIACQLSEAEFWPSQQTCPGFICRVPPRTGAQHGHVISISDREKTWNQGGSAATHRAAGEMAIAFPTEAQTVRPLAISAAGEVAIAMGWSLPDTLGVLVRWKMAPAYCKAILSHEHRIGLDGSTAEPIDDKARDLASKQLARLAARETATKAAESGQVEKPKPAEMPLEMPEQLRARGRASLMRRRA
jgi:hypothetical protein